MPGQPRLSRPFWRICAAYRAKTGNMAGKAVLDAASGLAGAISEAFKRALRADQLDIARGDAALMQAWGLRLIRQLWMAKPSEKEREFVQCLFLNTLLQLPHYRI